MKFMISAQLSIHANGKAKSGCSEIPSNHFCDVFDCPALLKTLGKCARLCRALMTVVSVIRAHRVGHPYPCTWVRILMYTGTSDNVRGLKSFVPEALLVKAIVP